jgi:hypothetical protein
VILLWCRARGEKHIERNAIVVSKLEKLNADVVVLHPLDGGKTHFDGRFVPGKIQHESEFLARLKQTIDTEPSPLTGKIKQGAVVGVLRQQEPDRSLSSNVDAPGESTVAHWPCLSLEALIVALVVDGQQEPT